MYSHVVENNLIASGIAKLGQWPLIVMLIINLSFRRRGKAAIKKRSASLYHAAATLLITSLAVFIVNKGYSDLYFWLGTAIVAFALYLLRHKAFPYRLTCVNCNTKMDFQTIFYMDDNLCSDCRENLEEEETPTESQAEDAQNP